MDTARIMTVSIMGLIRAEAQAAAADAQQLKWLWERENLAAIFGYLLKNLKLL